MSSLGAALRLALKERDVSIRQAARDIGLAHTTLRRVIQGEEISVDSLIRIAKWLGVSPATLLDEKAEGPEGLASQIALLLTQYPDLSRVFDEAVRRINSGQASDALLTDLVAYAAWRIAAQEKRNDRGTTGGQV